MRRALFGGFAIALSTVACSSTPAKPTTGIEMVISADHLTAPADFDDIRLEVSQLSGATWSKIWDRDYQVPSMEATLPTTFTVLGGQTADEVLIALTAYKGGAGGQPIVERVAQVQVPIDRLAALYLVLAQVCEGQVTSTGAEGEPTPTCPTGESCLPSTGHCGSDAIDANALPTFVPGESLDAGPDASDIVLRPFPETEAGGSEAGTEGSDATISDAGGSDASLEAAGDASACVPVGTGAVAILGCPCGAPGTHGCNGNAQNQALVCTNGSWTPNGICPTGQLCDTASGAQQGTCVSIDPACTMASPGDHVCSNATTVVQCGADLVSDSPVGTCSDQACVHGMCTGACAPGKTQCMNNGVQTCTTSGAFGTAVPCSASTCMMGSCMGSCSAGDTLCSGNAAVESCVNGTWGTAAPCTNQACVGKVCAGVCSPGATSCTTITAYETCDTTGQWQAAVGCVQPTPTCNQGTCVCPSGEAISNNVCCPSGQTGCSGSCVTLTNDPHNCNACGVTCPYGLCQTSMCVASFFGAGHPNPGTGTAISLGAGMLVGDRAPSGATSNVVALGAQTIDSGVSLRLALYSDNGGKPGTLLVQTAALSSVGHGATEGTVASTPVVSGTAYWIMILATAALHVATETPTVTWYYQTGTSFPATFTATTSLSTNFGDLYFVTAP
jgi:hypothetical protein